MNYQSLDAWKSCNTLLLCIAEVTRSYEGPERKLVGRLFYLALRAGGRVAFGKGTRNRKLFLRAAGQAGGFLSELQDHLSVVRVMGVLPAAACDRCDALRGRASLYMGRLFASLLAPRPGGREKADDE